MNHEPHIMKFDLTQNPPSIEAINNARREAEVALIDFRQRQRNFTWLVYGIIIIGIIVLLAVWQYGNDNLVAGVVACAIALAGVGFGGVVVFDVGVIVLLVAAVVLVTLIVVLAVAASADVAVVDGAFAAIFAFSAAVLVAGGSGLVLNKRHKSLIAGYVTAQSRIDALAELDATTMSERCIQFVEWMDSDDTVKDYQHQLAIMGRKPVVGEYHAAKAWIESSSQRATEADTIERARLACERMSVTG